MNKIESKKGWLSNRIEEEIKDLDSNKSSHPLIAIIVVAILTLLMLYLIAHQFLSTSFFTTRFGVLEMILLYGALIEWIVVASLEALGIKNLSRDIDAFGGMIFVTIGGIWLFFIFPFEFTYYADVLPESIRILLQWISADIARGVIVLWTGVNLVAAVYYGMIRVLVRKESYHRLGPLICGLIKYRIRFGLTSKPTHTRK